MVFKWHVSHISDMKQKQGGNYCVLESVYLLNGLNNPLKNDYIMECSKTSSDAKTSNTSQATERKKRIWECNSGRQRSERALRGVQKKSKKCRAEETEAEKELGR